ncbi:MAG: DUF4214 domain-containing protein [Lachnospiraceae bacterium]|nr:DUF4214 domain-containing protein [Lachnospiraceae bacterium]
MQYAFYGSDGYECAAGVLNIDSSYGSEYKYNIEFPADAVYVEFIMSYDHEFVYMADASATCIKDGATTIVPGINANDLEYNGCKVYVSDFTDNLCIEVSAMTIPTPGPTYSYLPVKLEQVDSQGNAAMVVDGLSSLKVDGISMTNDEMIVYDYLSGYCTLEIEVAYGCSISKAYFNGTELDLKDSGDGVHYTAEFLRDVIKFDNTTNEIRLVSGGTSSDVTVVWTDSAERSQQLYGNDDAYVANGKVEVVSIQRGGREIYNASMGNVENVVKITGEDGWVSLKKGDDVVLKLIPDYGYQLKSVDLNGCTAIPVDSSVSTFKIQNIQTNLHFKGIFEKSEDVINTAGSSLVKNAGIANGDHATASGNLSLTVADNKSYSRDVTGVVSGDTEKVAALDLTLDQVVSKGNGSSWTNAITSFAQDINVSLSIDGSALKEGESFGVVRDHNGILTELNAVYDTKTGTLTFPTNQFSTYTIVKKQVDENNVAQINSFVERMYTVALGRGSDADGLAYWCKELADNKQNAADIAYGFFFSTEYKQKNRSDEQYIDDLYETILGREADPEGKASWVKALKDGKSRESVLAGFVNSAEFSGMCDEYNIPRGTMEEDGSSICNSGVRSFVLRNYTKALGRQGETTGVEDWCNVINKKKLTPAAVAESFFQSQEFKNRKLSDEEYVEVLYETFLGRSSDPEGKAFWLSCLKDGKTRDDIIKGFSGSKEFSQIVAGFGL